MYDVDEVLKYLSEWRSTKEIREKFSLSNSEFFHLQRWLIKAKLAEKCKGMGLNEKSTKIGLSGELKNKQNRTWLYKAVK